MDDVGWSAVWLVVCSLAALFFSLNSLALRIFSRVKLQDAFKDAGKEHLTDKLFNNAEKLAGYEAQIKTHHESLADDSPDAIQASTAGFIRFATGTEKAGTAAHVSENTGIPEWYTPDEYLDAAR